MWWPIMQSLGEHLKADAALVGVEVNYGVKNPIAEVDTIDLRYGGTPKLDLHSDDEGTAQLWLDVTKKLSPNDAETAHETGAAYSDLHALMSLVLASVRVWWTDADISGLDSFKTSVEEIHPDGDSFRAYGVVAARIFLNINWRETGA